MTPNHPDLHPRFKTAFGNDCSEELRSGHLAAFSGLCRFQDRTWGITVWARDIQDAKAWCKYHGLTFDGRIIGTVPWD